jgi:hypothetical protein
LLRPVLATDFEEDMHLLVPSANGATPAPWKTNTFIRENFHRKWYQIAAHAESSIWSGGEDAATPADAQTAPLRRTGLKPVL